jgi:hypothetical protein
MCADLTSHSTHIPKAFWEFARMDEEDSNDEMAAAMGFSSFGGAKKRKFDQTNSPKTSKPDSSGANSTKLGVRTKTMADGTESGAKTGVTNEAGETTDPAGNASQSQPPSISKPSKTKGKQKQKQPAASGLAAFLNLGKGLPEKPLTGDKDETDVPLTQDAQTSPDTADMISFGGEPIPRAKLNMLRSGVKNENGDTAYFLPSFVEDPWANLRKSKS